MGLYLGAVGDFESSYNSAIDFVFSLSSRGFLDFRILFSSRTPRIVNLSFISINNSRVLEEEMVILCGTIDFRVSPFHRTSKIVNPIISFDILGIQEEDRIIIE